MKKVWRIGSNWDGEDIFPLFKKYFIAFAGEEVSTSFEKMAKGDLVCITKGQEILAIGIVNDIVPLSQIDSSLGDKYDSVNAVRLGNLFSKEDYPSLNFGKYDGQGRQFNEAHGEYKALINDIYSTILKMGRSEEFFKVLKHKHQIILQGPPGTGKTRLAKEIASQLTSPEEIDFQDIHRLIKVGMEISSSSNRAEYKVSKVESESLDYFRKSTNNYGRLSFQDICKAFKDRIWLNQKISNGSDTYSAAFAKYILENYTSEQVKIVQFHPSYSYEDFVRGISVTSENGVVTYNTENRTLAEFASEALQNQINSNKDQTDYARELLIAEKIKAYAQYLNELLENPDNWSKSEIQLTPAIRITNVEDNAFKFAGSDWYDRLKFDQIKSMLLLRINSADEIRNTPGFLKTVYHRTTYYLKVVQHIRAKFPEVDQVPSQATIKEPLKNYVLIIDEINRANLPSVLGELIYALEYRDEVVNGLYSIEGDSTLIIPKNLFIIGTMNTSDRSVGHIDYAIRRRFAFVDVLPEILSIEHFQKDAFKHVSQLFIKNFDEYAVHPTVKLEKSDCLNDEFRPEDVWLGHSYFIAEDKDFDIRKKYEILPILKEYVKDGILRDTPETWKLIDALVE